MKFLETTIAILSFCVKTYCEPQITDFKTTTASLTPFPSQTMSPSPSDSSSGSLSHSLSSSSSYSRSRTSSCSPSLFSWSPSLSSTSSISNNGSSEDFNLNYLYAIIPLILILAICLIGFFILFRCKDKNNITCYSNVKTNIYANEDETEILAMQHGAKKISFEAVSKNYGTNNKGGINSQEPSFSTYYDDEYFETDSSLNMKSFK